MKNKVLVFITRRVKNERELLVFDHRDHPEAGTQIPAGTVEDGETLETAVFREVFEESGLRLLDPGRLLGKFDYTFDSARQRELRHVFHVHLDSPTKEQWQHTVGGDGEDQGMVFQYRWVPLTSAHNELHKFQNEYLPLI
jgi:8-oxo-dGTP pyrophosphatase MutT (NUDIX family)